MLIDVIQQFISIIEINYFHLMIFMTSVLIIGTFLFHLSNWLRIPEVFATPFCVIGAISFSILILKGLIFLK
ncbi:hypothetical protein ACFSO7_21725 [Bacillus sp. CGMCC 1.16607]|uniref:hypothetical protein n=1 Tax=Bacillus sp. CGMCC 1.16607 TaxID=3351842 RepID=UPI0036359931